MTNAFKIEELQLVALRLQRQYGSAIFVRNTLKINSARTTKVNDVELFYIEFGNCTVTSLCIVSKYCF